MSTTNDKKEKETPIEEPLEWGKWGDGKTKPEMKEFFEKLPQGAFDKIRQFFDTMPRLRHEQEVTNPKTGVKSKVTFEGLNDFFGLASPIIA